MFSILKAQFLAFLAETRIRRHGSAMLTAKGFLRLFEASRTSSLTLVSASPKGRWHLATRDSPALPCLRGNRPMAIPCAAPSAHPGTMNWLTGDFWSAKHEPFGQW